MAVAADLVAKTSEAFGAEGTLFFSTSRRTPAETTEALAANLPAGAQLFRWQPDQSENPYLALLGLADRCVVTGDSISMMVEAVRAGKPLSIFALPTTGSLYARFLQFLQKQQSSKAVAAIARLLYGLGLVGFGRDLTALHQSLFRQGFATPLGQSLPKGIAPKGRVPDDLEPVVTRIKELLYKSEDYRTPQRSEGS